MSTVVVTGGNRGIGEGIVREFLAAGYQVLVGARTDTRLEVSLGAMVRFCPMDVTQRSDHHALVKTALNWTGRVDVYVNCAGFSRWRSIDCINEEVSNQMIQTNLMGTLWGCQAAASVLPSGGSIINVSSIAGKRGSANNSLYCATKFGVNGITQSLAKELGSRGIRVNAVCPVLIHTPGLMEALQDEQSPTKGKDVGQFFAAFTQANAALGRLPTAQEVGAVCVFLASPQASAITGQCLNVDCGVFPQ
ncbi:SDR family oxidoreductase [Candidatus Uhrbacteria bacterium]|nr:SDR family oxidoreductase [Candidatus Uhrbacteria bacterium]